MGVLIAGMGRGIRAADAFYQALGFSGFSAAVAAGAVPRSRPSPFMRGAYRTFEALLPGLVMGMMSAGVLGFLPKTLQVAARLAAAGAILASVLAREKPSLPLIGFTLATWRQPLTKERVPLPGIHQGRFQGPYGRTPGGGFILPYL